LFAGPSSSAWKVDWSAEQKLTTTVSTKGQVILPKAIRERLRWRAGTELVVEDTAEGYC
jgi:AbrB family looped-hinge helix DNA binding protein